MLKNRDKNCHLCSPRTGGPEEQQVDQEPKKGGLGAEAQRNQLAGMQEPWSWSEDSHGEGGGAAKA